MPLTSKSLLLPVMPALRLSSLSLLTLLAACTTISPMPNQILWRASTEEVVSIMGQPDYTSVTSSQIHPEAAYTWSYRDQWHRTPNQPDVWASWDLYFNLREEFIGWRLVEPAPPLNAARESFVSTSAYQRTTQGK